MSFIAALAIGLAISLVVGFLTSTGPVDALIRALFIMALPTLLALACRDGRRLRHPWLPAALLAVVCTGYFLSAGASAR